jgi:hypothetical protein
MATNADIGRWKFPWIPEMYEVYYLGLERIDLNFPLFGIVKRSQNVTLQCGAHIIRVLIGYEYRSVIGESCSFTLIASGRISREEVI